MVDDLAELLRRDAEIRKQRRDAEERSQKSVALHAELKVGTIGRLARDLKAGQGEYMELLVNNLPARPQRQPLPGLLTFLVGFPHQTAERGHSVERVGMRERFGIAAQYHVDVTKV